MCTTSVVFSQDVLRSGFLLLGWAVISLVSNRVNLWPTRKSGKVSPPPQQSVYVCARRWGSEGPLPGWKETLRRNFWTGGSWLLTLSKSCTKLQPWEPHRHQWGHCPNLLRYLMTWCNKATEIPPVFLLQLLSLVHHSPSLYKMHFCPHPFFPPVSLFPLSPHFLLKMISDVYNFLIFSSLNIHLLN